MYRSASSVYAGPNPSAIYPFTYTPAAGFVESLPSASLFGSLERKTENAKEINRKREPSLAEHQSTSPEETMVIKKESVLLESGSADQVEGEEEEDGDVGGGSEDEDDDGDGDGEPSSMKVARMEDWSPRMDKVDSGIEVKPVTTPLSQHSEIPNYLPPPTQCFASSALTEIPTAQMISYQIYGQFPSQYHPHMGQLPPPPLHTTGQHPIYTSLASDINDVGSNVNNGAAIQFPHPTAIENTLSSAKGQPFSTMQSQWHNVVSIYMAKGSWESKSIMSKIYGNISTEHLGGSVT